MKRNGRGSNIDVVRTGGRRRLRLALDAGAPSALVRAAMRYFDDDFLAVKGLVVELPAFIERARKLDPSFVCTPAALNMILEERDRQRRHAIADSLADSEIEAVVKAPLLPYQVQGARFVFRAGRAVLADDPGMGKVVQTLVAIELFKARNMAARALVVCPTSLKYQWAKEIERLTGCRHCSLKVLTTHAASSTARPRHIPLCPTTHWPTTSRPSGRSTRMWWSSTRPSASPTGTST